jgi:UPF0755 protein
MKLIKLLVAVAGLGAVAALAVLLSLTASTVQPAAPVSIEIPRGLGTQGIATLLAKEGVVASRWHFLAARALAPGARLQAGLYDFSKAASANQVLDRLRRGDVHLYSITVPEGSNMWEVAAIAAKLGWFSSAAFLKAAQDPALVAALLPELRPAPKSLEGYLFPSTYRLANGMTPRQIIQQMVGEFRHVWMGLDAQLPMQEAVTLASLVETEAKLPTERETVASVYRNRVDRGWLLGCDPTVMYAAMLEGKYRGTIYKSDLERDHPYNTYLKPGLPPGPIANPGAASLQAALHPAKTGYIYFVARGDGSGGHVFTENAAEHNRAVAQYRRNVGN